MDAPTITMPKATAMEKLEAYRESMRRRTDEEHAQLVEAYEALAEGTPLISLQDAIEFAGFDEKGRPNVAIARADRTQVRYYVSWRWRNGGRPIVFDARKNDYNSDTLCIETLPRNVPRDYRTGYALVPMIPADVRNRMSGQPRDHFILWEVEEWSDSPLGAQPDIDPLLLKRIGADLFAVVDSWDLTDIERLIMRGRAER